MNKFFERPNPLNASKKREITISDDYNYQQNVSSNANEDMKSEVIPF